MIERRPFTPEDYRIGHEGVKGTSDYPTKGTPPRDLLLSPHTGKRRMSVHGSVEPHGSIQTPEDALIEAEEVSLRGERRQATEEGNNEGFEGGVGEVDDSDEAQESHDPTTRHRLQGRIDSGKITIGLRADSQRKVKYNLLRRAQKTEESHGTHKPKGKKPRHF